MIMELKEYSLNRTCMHLDSIYLQQFTGRKKLLHETVAATRKIKIIFLPHNNVGFWDYNF